VEVFLANEQGLTVDETRLTALAHHVLSAEGLQDEGELSILLVTADHIRRLNDRFAGDDYPTDVLAFPMLEDDGSSEMLGDVVVCPEVAEGNAQKLGHGLDDELDILLVHGTLHLLGYDHQNEDEKKKMEARLREILGSFAASQA
jgi:probable rRNA maturation factor